jgi:uncharacterized protein YydD (DUF2326 family)
MNAIVRLLEAALAFGEALLARSHDRDEIVKLRRELDELHKKLRELHLRVEVDEALLHTKPRD